MASADDAGIGEEPEYEEKLDDKPKSILMSMIKQLKTGMDLSKVSLLDALQFVVAPLIALRLLHSFALRQHLRCCRQRCPVGVPEPTPDQQHRRCCQYQRAPLPRG